MQNHNFSFVKLLPLACCALWGAALLLPPAAALATAVTTTTATPAKTATSTAIATQQSTFATPHKVLLSRQDARVMAETVLQTRMLNGQKILLLPLPQDAQDLSLELAAPHAASLRSWRVESSDALPAQGTVAQQHQALQNRRDQTLGEVRSLRARLALWTTAPSIVVVSAAQGAGSPPLREGDALRERETALQQAVPPLSEQLAKAERTLKVLEQQLAAMPQTALTSRLAVITVDTALAEGTPLTVRHAYTLNNASWQPRYMIEALPAASVAEDKVRVTLLADVQQYSGLDWSKATVELSDAALVQREPATLPPWLVRKGSPLPKGLSRNAAAMSPMLMDAAPQQHMMMANVPEARSIENAPQPQEGLVLASWTVPQGYVLPEGMTTLPLLQEEWNVTLQRVARPGNGDTRVWLLAKHELHDARWPSGNASFSVDGVNVGKGSFLPQNDSVELYFGVDPLVTVRAEPDTRKSGKSGVVNKRQTWNWGWVYTVYNKRDKAVQVRMEDARTQATDEAISVKYEDSPPAQQGENHTLWWNVTVPAQDKAQVRRTVTVTAPQDMDIHPGR